MDNNIPTIDLTQDEDGDTFNQDNFQKSLLMGTISQFEFSISFENLIQSTELINELTGNSLDSSVSTGNVS